MSDPVDPSPPAVVAYARRGAGNRPATVALVFGIVGVFTPFVASIVAILLGRRGIRRAAEAPDGGGGGVARTAILLGAAGLLFWTMAALVSIPILARIRRNAQLVACMSNMRQLSVNIHMYAMSNQGYLPPTLDALAKSTMIPNRLLQCPAAAASGAAPGSSGSFGTSSFIYVGAGRRLQSLRNPPNTPLLYEPLRNHGNRINVAYADGHVATLSGTQAAQLLKQVTNAPAPTAPPSAALPTTAPPSAGPVSQPVEAPDQ
jgi:prepilin-type processing-associated H-X9-DG protein